MGHPLPHDCPVPSFPILRHGPFNLFLLNLGHLAHGLSPGLPGFCFLRVNGCELLGDHVLQRFGCPRLPVSHQRGNVAGDLSPRQSVVAVQADPIGQMTGCSLATM